MRVGEFFLGVRLNKGVRAASFYEDHLGVFWITYITSSPGGGPVVLDGSTHRLISYSLYEQRSGKSMPVGFRAAAKTTAKHSG